MNKQALAATLLAGLSCGVAKADTFFGAYAGAQLWQMEADSSIKSGSTTTSVNLDDKSQGSFYLALEHPVPLVPNLRLIRTNMDIKGGTGLTATIDMKSTDYVLYYELFDNDVISFDFGISAKDVDGSFSVENKAVANSKQSKMVSKVIPMLYGRAEFGVPGSDLGLMAQVSTQPFGSENSYDYQAAVTYSLLDNMAIDTKLQLGYRAFSLEVDDLVQVSPELEFKGAFVGLEVHF